MKYIGAHVSAQGGVEEAPLNAAAIGARSFALFTANASRWAGKKISDSQASLFKERCAKLGYAPHLILPHDSYLINLGSPDPQKLAMSRKAFGQELERCRLLGLTMVNFHPGSHVNLCSPEECLATIAESLNIALAETPGVTAVIENTAGQGSNLGYDFRQIADIISQVEDKSRVGVCIDTCHAYSAGYDLASEEGYRRVWQEFDDVIGRDYLKAIHLNDDKRERGSRIDRHASLGQGTLGEDFFRRFMNDPRFDDMPVILETPDDSVWAREIEWLYSLAEPEDA